MMAPVGLLLSNEALGRNCDGARDRHLVDGRRLTPRAEALRSADANLADAESRHASTPASASTAA